MQPDELLGCGRRDRQLADRQRRSRRRNDRVSAGEPRGAQNAPLGGGLLRDGLDEERRARQVGQSVVTVTVPGRRRSPRRSRFLASDARARSADGSVRASTWTSASCAATTARPEAMAPLPAMARRSSTWARHHNETAHELIADQESCRGDPRRHGSSSPFGLDGRSARPDRHPADGLEIGTVLNVLGVESEGIFDGLVDAMAGGARRSSIRGRGGVLRTRRRAATRRRRCERLRSRSPLPPRSRRRATSRRPAR